MRRTAHRIGLLLLLALSAWAQPAHADVRVEVRGRMRIDVDRIERAAHSFVVSGVLLDEATQEPMSNHVVALRVTDHTGGHERDAYRYAVPTEADGSFRFRVQAQPDARYTIRLAAGEAEGYAEARPVEREIDLGRRNLELRIIAANEVSAGAATLPVVLEAVALDDEPSDVSQEEDLGVDLELDGKPLATLLLKGGRASYQIPLSPMDTHGELQLHARFAGDARRSPAEAVAHVRILERFALSLASEGDQAPAGREVSLTGTLLLAGKGVPGLSVTVERLAEDDGAPAGPHQVVTTDDGGGFRVRLPTPAEGADARFRATIAETQLGARRVAAAASPIVVVAIVPARALPRVLQSPTGLALFVEALLGFGLVALRLRTKMKARRAPAEAPPAGKVPAPERKLFATLRLASDRRVSGRVEESDRGRPLVGATVRVRVAEREQVAVTEADGGFFFAEIPEGQAQITVEREGYRSDVRKESIPHRGALLGLVVALKPWRAEIFRRYAEALAPLLPPGEKLGARTPRELARLAEPKFNDRAGLRALQHLVELRCFGPGPISRPAFEEVNRTLDRLKLPPT